jgi:glucose/arabinose dehydrogenase
VWSEYFRGLIDEVRVYNRALSAADIQADMATPVGAPAPGDTTAPSVALTAPAAGTVTGTVAVAANASDDRGVAGVQFRLDGTDLGTEDTSAPFSTSWDTATSANGSHTLTAVARDGAGNRTTSAPVQVTVSNTTPRFVNDRVVVGLNEPTALRFTPDGRMLIAERDGTIWVAQPGATQVDPQPFLQIPSVARDNERGLLGFALDPSFSTNGYIYVFYTHTNLRNRVSRFTSAGPTSERIVWENTRNANIWHQGGDVQFGPDGNLYISVGDHLDAQSAQSLTAYSGKILRITRDGAAPTDNPFYDGAGPNLDAIWARGFRNPFRFTIDPTSGRMLIGDVGEGTREEINLGVRGANYGWPACEGPCSVSGMTSPIHSYTHSGRDASVTGGFVYRGTQFPSEYVGSYFFGDYAQNWIRRLTLDANGNVTGVHNFEPADGRLDGPFGDIVGFAEGPDGSLWYVDAGPFEQGNAGSIRRIRNTTANQPPVVAAVADRMSGAAPLTVQFSSTGSRDPEGQPVTYRWEFGDGATSTAASPSHTYDSGRFTARLTVSDGTLSSSSEPIVITAGSPPTATISSPAPGRTFRAGETITFSGTGQDADDGPLPGSSLSWKVVFHHDDHIHPVMDATGGSGAMQVPDTGHSFQGDTRFELVLTAVDSDGITASTSTMLEPEKARLAVDTEPSGLGVSLDGIATNAPVGYDELVGFRRTVGAPSPQVTPGGRYAFQSWSDGGAQSHAVTVPPAGISVSARFALEHAQPTGLVAAYAFDEGNGATLYDATGRGRNGTISGALWSGAGRHVGALQFDGVNDSVRIADHADLDLTTAMTIEAWVRPSTVGSWRTVIFKEQTSHMTYALYGSVDGRPTGQVYVGGQREVRSASTITANTWIHLAATYDGAALRLYVNGTEVRSLAVTGSMTVSTGPLKLGGNAIWNEWFAGLMDDVRIYSRALTAAEIRGDMETAVTLG